MARLHPETSRSSQSHRAALALLLAVVGVFPRAAHADFVKGYDLVNFTLTNSTFANGYATPINGGASLLLTGPNDGSGLPGTTDFTIAARGDGLFEFTYLYTSADPLPGYDFAGYVVSGSFFKLADFNGQLGSISTRVLLGDVIGFRIGSADNQGEPGRLLVTYFRAPEGVVTPEAEGSSLMLIGSVILLAAAAVKKGRKSRAGWLLLLLVALAACLPTAGLAQSQTQFLGSNATGQLVLTNTVNLSQLPPQLGASRLSIREMLPKIPPKRLLPPRPALTPRGGTLLSPPMAALAITSATNSTGFNALSHRDQRLANNENQFSIEPPSPGLAVANGYVLEGVNNAVRVYYTSGSPALPLTVSSNQLFGLPPAIDRVTGVNGPYLTDMRVHYDSTINRWFVVQRSQDNDIYGNPLNSSHLYLAVSRTPDPTAEYSIYVMDTTNPGQPGCPCLPDYPQIGTDQYGFHIAWNQFNTLSQTFVNAVVFSISKASLQANAITPNAYQFQLPSDTTYNFSIQPAITPPKASNFLAGGGVAYFVSSTVFGGNSIALWAMSNTSSLATPTPAPALTRVTLPTLAYTWPDVATQRPGPIPYGASVGGSLAFLDGGDSRVQTVFYAGGRLYVTLPTGVRDENTRLLVGGAYFVISPTLRSGVLAGSVLNQGYLLVSGNHLLRPAMAVNPFGRGAIAVTLVGPDWFPSAAVISIDTFSTPTTVEVVCPGALPEDGFTGYEAGRTARWGDYNAAFASADGSVWMVAQYIGDFPRTEFANWNTYVMRKPAPLTWPTPLGGIPK